MILTKICKTLTGKKTIKYYWKDINKDLDKWRALACS